MNTDFKYESSGYLRYFDDPKKLIVTVDPELVDYYRKSVFLKINRQKYDPHISVVRNEIPTGPWRKYEGELINFKYSGEVRNDEVYYWLPIECRRLEQVRVELGLPLISDITLSPDKFHRFHVTIGNLKR